MSVINLEEIKFSYQSNRNRLQVYGYADFDTINVGVMRADMHLRQKFIDLFWLAVDKDYRDKGIATTFIQKLNEWGVENSAVEICCAILPAVLVDITPQEYRVALTKMGFTKNPFSDLFRKKIE